MLKHLKVAKVVAAGTDEVDDVIPSTGKKVLIALGGFNGEGSFTKDVEIRLVWRYQHATESEEIIWTIHGSSKIPFDHAITDADGVRKLAIVVKNQDIVPVALAGHLDYDER